MSIKTSNKSFVCVFFDFFYFEMANESQGILTQPHKFSMSSHAAKYKYAMRIGGKGKGKRERCECVGER